MSFITNKLNVGITVDPLNVIAIKNGIQELLKNNDFYKDNIVNSFLEISKPEFFIKELLN
jgi:hypothetical protein